MTAKKTSEDKSIEATPVEKEQIKYCGVVMPIAAMLPEYTEAHWKGVLRIIEEAATIAGYKARLVSESETSNIIQKDIVQNLYKDEIIICDVSGRNPNVMFELGLRLAFDKPTIIIKDNITDYSFDISPIKHIPYPKDLNYHSINLFKNDLSSKIRGSIDAAENNADYSVFLKHFKDVQITPSTLAKEEISIDKALVEQLNDIQHRLIKMEKNSNESFYTSNNKNRESYDISTSNIEEVRPEFVRFFQNNYSKYFDEFQYDADKWTDAFQMHLVRKFKSTTISLKALPLLKNMITEEIYNLPF